MVNKLNRVERWRRERGFTQRQLAEEFDCSDATITRAEHRLPIRRTFIDKYLAASDGFLKARDFIEADKPGPKGRTSGTQSKAKRQKEKFEEGTAPTQRRKRSKR